MANDHDPELWRREQEAHEEKWRREEEEAALRRQEERWRNSGFRSYQEVMQIIADPNRDWRIKGVVPNGITLLVGPSGVGKSLLVMSWAYHMASGAPWFGHDVKQGCVVYLCPELSVSAYSTRIHALRATSAHEPADNPMFVVRLQDKAAYALNTRKVRFDRPTDTEELISFLHSFSLTDGLLIIDTLFEHYSGEENSSGDMGLFVKSLRAIRAACPDLDIIVVHHTSRKGAQERGHTSLKGAVDLVLRLDGNRTLKALKVRGAPVQPLQLQIQEIDLRVPFPERFTGPEQIESAVMRVAGEGTAQTGLSELEILRALSRFTEGATMTQWSNATGVPHTTLRRWVTRELTKWVDRRDDKRFTLTEAGRALVESAAPTIDHSPPSGG
jgi:predicted ATP-dependent serine protease